jgi:hypothetical protein
MTPFARFTGFRARFLPYLTIIAALGSACDATAVGRIASVSVIDRETGEVLPTHYYRGEYWVAGQPGARYGIQIRNGIGGRLLAVTSVDGVNVVSGATAAWNQTGYVLDTSQTYEITGWRKSDTHVAAFTFTDSSQSYASRTGRPANIGVIGVAVFREKPVVLYAAPDTSAEEATNAASRAQAPAAGESAARDSVAKDSRSAPAVSQPELASKLGTGHGPREYSSVAHTDFERLQPQPDEVIRIRYDSLANLMAMGIVRRPPPLHPSANPFPDSPTSEQYVPDPPGS